MRRRAARSWCARRSGWLPWRARCRVAAPPWPTKRPGTRTPTRSRSSRATGARAHEYHVDETLEAGVVLAGSEVKSIRAGKATLVDAFADIDRGEAWLHQVDIGVYPFAHGRNHDPRRKRKLLLHRREIDRLAGQDPGKGLHAGAAEPVREEGSRESRAGAGARQAAVGQARGFQEAREPARDRPRDVGAPEVEDVGSRKACPHPGRLPRTGEGDSLKEVRSDPLPPSAGGGLGRGVRWRRYGASYGPMSGSPL